MAFEPIDEPYFEWQPELEELLDHLRRRRSSILGWIETPAEIFLKIHNIDERDTPFDSLFDEAAHVLESYLINPDCLLEDAFSDTYKRLWVEAMFNYKPHSWDYTDVLGQYATQSLRGFLAYVVDHIPPYWSRDQYLLIHDMEVRPIERVSG